MKKIIFFLILLLVSPVSADTNISGLISSDATWSPSGGVYIINSSFSIAPGITLTIEPGTIIKARSTSVGGPSIYGHLIARGTSESPIYFTSVSDDEVGGDTLGNGPSVGTPGQWQGLYFKPGSTGKLEHVIVRYSGEGGFGFGNFVGIENDGGILSIKSSYIHDNYKFISGFKNGQGIWQKGGTLTIENSVISNQVFGLMMTGGVTTATSSRFLSNTGYGVYASGGDSLTLMDNDFSGNDKTAYITVVLNFSHNGNISSDITNRGFEITGNLESDAVWHSNDLPVIIPNGGSVSVPIGHTLTINPASIVKLGSRGQMIIEGTLVSHGAKTEKIYFTSLKDDSVDGDTNGDGNASVPDISNWDGITFKNGSNGEMSHSIIRYSGGFNGIGRSGIFNLGGNILLGNISFSNNSQNDLFQNTGSSTISYSTFSISTDQAILNTETSALDARLNWWGSSTGPRHFTNATGTGAKVSDNVRFNPWLKGDPSLSPLHTPVIIVPGILSSKLMNSLDSINSEIWPAGPLLLFPLDLHLNSLSLLEDGITSLSNIQVGDLIDSIGDSDFFSGLINTLESENYHENVDLFVFPYDWRIDVEQISALLKSKIDEIVSKTGTESVNVVAHSMGGLIIKEYLKNNNEIAINKFIDVSTPHTGAPKSFKILNYGDNLYATFFFGQLGLNSERVKIISQNMPSVYQLLPSQNYFDDSDNNYRYYIFDAISGSDRLTYNQTKNYLKTSGRNGLLVDRADEFHREIDDLDPADYGVKTYNIIGCGTPTIGQFYILDRQGDHYTYNIRVINGDGTVPLKSAEAMPALKKYYVKNTQHALIPSAAGVKELITDILISTSTDYDISSYSNISTNSADCPIPDGKIISFHSPIELHVYDESGNHAGPDENGDIENNISGVIYEVIEDNKFTFLPNGAKYEVKGEASEVGTFDIRIQEIVDETIATTTLFNNLAITNTSNAAFVIDSSTPTDISIDYDGDGIFETSKSYTSISTGFVEGASLSQTIQLSKTSSSVTKSSRSERSWTTTIPMILPETGGVPTILSTDSLPRSSLIQSVVINSAESTLVEMDTSEIDSTTRPQLSVDTNQDTIVVHRSFVQLLKDMFMRLWLWIINRL